MLVKVTARGRNLGEAAARWNARFKNSGFESQNKHSVLDLFDHPSNVFGW